LPQEIAELSGKTSRFRLTRLAVGQRKMEIFDGLAARQPPAESHGLDGCLTEIQAHALGYHRVKATP
jgi:hypothetical protein